MTVSLRTRQSLRKAELERYLSDGVLDSTASPNILDSWRRCLLEGLHPDRYHVPFDSEAVHPDSPFLRAAAPVLERLSDRLQTTGTSVFLTDSRARIIWRWVDAPDLRRRLDRVNCGTGFWFAEQFAGTNGVGTVIESGHPVEVIGADHFAGTLDSFACIGAPVRNPITRHIEGVLDVTIHYRQYSSLILPVVLEAAQLIEDRLYAAGSRRELTLLEHFLTAKRRSTNAIVSMSDKVVIANPAAARILKGVDQEFLWELASRAVTEHSDAIHQLVLSDGRLISARCRPVGDAGSVIGALIEIEVPRAGGSPPRSRRCSQGGESLPGLVGRSQAWRALTKQALRYSHESLPILVTGEPGVGKLAVLRAIARLRGIDQISVFDAAQRLIEGGENWLRAIEDRLRARTHFVIVRHLEALGQLLSEGLVLLLDKTSSAQVGDRPWIAGTVTIAEGSHPQIWRPLYDRLAALRLDVPPLRERPEDIAELVQHFVEKHSETGQRCRPEVLHLLERLDWPGNVREVANASLALIRSATSREIGIENLPDHLRCQGGRRTLSKMERAELEVISKALGQVDGNKQAAAKVLGISRATLYRKLKAYGAELDRRTF